MRALKGQIAVQLLLGYISLGLLHGLRRILSFYYHRALETMGSALPIPTDAVGVPVLGGGFYCPQPLEIGQRIALPETVAHHVQVLRLRVGDVVTLFNGDGGE